MELWLPIPSFPGYSVSDCGRVRNEITGRLLALRINSHGIPFVGLNGLELDRQGNIIENGPRVQHQRTVARLVLSAFMEKPALEPFDTPINLDGDRRNNHIDNLTWRPLWFARKYLKQFECSPQGFNRPVEIIDTGERFKSSWEAATKYGLLDKDILLATLNRTYVWPTFQFFRVLE